MANNFNIVISATDKATASVRKVNNSISKLTRPIANVQRSMKSLGAELGRNPAVKALGRITRVAGGAAAAVAKVAVPMAGLAGVASIAGIAALATEWGRLGFEIGKTSALLDVSGARLHSLRGAAELAGVSSETLTGGLGALRQTLQDARWGRNQPVMGLMNRLNIGFHKTANGSIDAVRGLKDVADAIASQKDVGAKHTIAQAFGVAELLPLLMKGSKGIEELERRFGSFAGVRTNAAIASAEEFGRRLVELKAATQGLKIEIGSALMPVLEPLIEKFARWVALNREPIGKHIGEWADRFAKWIQETDFDKAAQRIEKIGKVVVWVIDKVALLIDKLDRLNNPTKYIFGGVPRIIYDLVKGDSQPSRQSSSGKITVAPPSNSAPSGMPAGIRNNNPGNLRSWGNNPTSGGFAVFRSPVEGIEAMAKQLQLYGGRGIDTVRGIISKWAPASENNTGAYIDSVAKQTGLHPDQKLNLGDARTLAPLVSAMIRHENGQNPYSKDMIEGAVSHVVVEFKNAPAGTTAVAKTKSGSDVPVRISHSLPTLAAG